MSASEGAIEGKLQNSDGGPFDLSLASPTGPAGMEIQLMSPDRAVVASASTFSGKPRFVFNHVKPGAYELSVYRSVPGLRTIAGSEPVTVNAGEVMPVKIRLQVTNTGDEGAKG